MAKKKAKHAGGRPLKHGEPTTLVSAKLPQSLLVRLETFAEQHNMNRSEAIVTAISRLPIANEKAD